MINQSIGVIATILVLVAPFALVPFVVVLVVAYPWLLLIPLGIGYLVVKYGSDEVRPVGRSPTPVSTAGVTSPDNVIDAVGTSGVAPGNPTDEPSALK
jgi:hypothetical protein